MRTVWITLIVVVLLVLIFAGQMISIRNELVAQREAINAAWAAIDVALQRRADLIPNLVETVKGFAAQEKEILESIANARAAMINARTPQERLQANARLDSALGRLLVVVERYPELKSNETFMRLMDELAGTENRIAVERRKYNQAVQRYNTMIQQFPNNIVAGLFGFSRVESYFQATSGAREVPKVKF